jgi:hypothetical protein
MVNSDSVWRIQIQNAEQSIQHDSTTRKPHASQAHENSLKWRRHVRNFARNLTIDQIVPIYRTFQHRSNRTSRYGERKMSVGLFEMTLDGAQRTTMHHGDLLADNRAGASPVDVAMQISTS